MARSEVTPELERIGGVIRDKREQQGDTQKQLAEKAGISPDRIGDVEVGHRASRRTYLAIARALDMSVEEMDELTGQEVGVG